MDGTFEGETFPHSCARWRTGFLAGPWHAELLHTRASHSRMWDLPGRNETGLGHKSQSAKADISAGAPDFQRTLTDRVGRPQHPVETRIGLQHQQIERLAFIVEQQLGNDKALVDRTEDAAVF